MWQRRFSETNCFPFKTNRRKKKERKKLPKENVYPFLVAGVVEHEMLFMECALLGSIIKD